MIVLAYTYNRRVWLGGGGMKNGEFYLKIFRKREWRKFCLGFRETNALGNAARLLIRMFDKKEKKKKKKEKKRDATWAFWTLAVCINQPVLKNICTNRKEEKEIKEMEIK